MQYKSCMLFMYSRRMSTAGNDINIRVLYSLPIGYIFCALKQSSLRAFFAVSLLFDVSLLDRLLLFR